jgi:hypothetical protein
MLTPLKLPAIISIPSDSNEVIGTYYIATVFMNTEPPCRLPCDLDWSSLSMSELITGSLGFYPFN